MSEDKAGSGKPLSNPPVDVGLSRTTLQRGEIELLGRMPYSSNATFLARVVDGESVVNGIYKPAKGERPLWDFPAGLYRREIAAYELSEELGWGVVGAGMVSPLTIGPKGIHNWYLHGPL